MNDYRSDSENEDFQYGYRVEEKYQRQEPEYRRMRGSEEDIHYSRQVGQSYQRKQPVHRRVRRYDDESPHDRHIEENYQRRQPARRQARGCEEEESHHDFQDDENYQRQPPACRQVRQSGDEEASHGRQVKEKYHRRQPSRMQTIDTEGERYDYDCQDKENYQRQQLAYRQLRGSGDEEPCYEHQNKENCQRRHPVCRQVRGSEDEESYYDHQNMENCQTRLPVHRQVRGSEEESQDDYQDKENCHGQQPLYRQMRRPEDDESHYRRRVKEKYQRQKPACKQGNFIQRQPHKDYKLRHNEADCMNSDEENFQGFVYQDSRKDFRPKTSKHIKKNAVTSKVSPEGLVYTLSTFQDFKASLIELFENRDLHPATVRGLAESNPETFFVTKHNVFLRPRISVCSGYMKTSGCPSKSNCKNFHICEDYLFRTCKANSCPFGHEWQTNHNSNLLFDLYLHNLPPEILKDLATTDPQRKSCNYPLDICFNYNSERCKFRFCKRLHLCLSFSKNAGTCTKTTCQLNHDIKASFCLPLLRKHDIPTDESPRDTLQILVSANPKLKQFVSRNQCSKDGSSNSNQKSQNTVINYEASSLPRMPRNLNNQHKVNNVDTSPRPVPKTPQRMNSQSNFSQKPKISKFNEITGDCILPEICFESVKGKCKNELNGCQRLHANRHFHWQLLGDDGKWYNFHEDLVMRLERSFCDPACEAINIRISDNSRLDPLIQNLATILGTNTWEADFEIMTLQTTSKNKSLKVRRLCSEKVTQHNVCENIYLWYFKDVHNKWIRYGAIDSTGNSKMKSSLSSLDIETQFTKNPSSQMDFSTPCYAYVLDFTNMCQTNKQTNVRRKIRRRPYPHLKPQQSSDSFQEVSHSSHWSPQVEDEIKIPEICFYSVVGTCKYGASECPRLHAKQHYCWQVCRNGSSWMSLDPKQGLTLEFAFCNPNKDGIALPVVDNFEWEFPGNVLFGLMGKSTWTANFQSMNLFCSSTGETLQLRRLCSQIVPESSLKVSQYHWYFKDTNDKWILYGQYDSTKKVGMESSISTTDVDRQFVRNTSARISFHTGYHKYILDCSKMSQINQSTLKTREVRKRPKPHLRSLNLPKEWEIMSPSESVRTEKLSHSSAEYKKVSSLFQSSLPSNVKVVRINRIQNPNLWKIFQKKAFAFESNTSKKVCQLFHGTRHNLLPQICYDNFNSKDNGCPRRGIPFSQDAGGAYKYCKATKHGHNYMIIAKVLSDNTTPNANNPLGGLGLFLRTMSAEDWKTDVTEIYPEYIIKLTGGATIKQPC